MNDIIKEDYIFFNVEAPTKDELLEFIANHAQKLGICDDAAQLKADLLKREGEFATGLMDGFAIPHARSSAMKQPSVFYVQLSTPIEWGTMDDKPVTNLFSLLVPTANEDNIHLKMISQLATCLMHDDFKTKVKSTTDKAELTAYIAENMEI